MRHYNKKEPKIYRTIRGKWKVRFYDESLESYRDRIVATKTEAENLRRSILQNDWPEATKCLSKNISFAALAEKWLDHAKNVRRISASCLMTYNTHLNHHILPILGDVLIHKLKLEDIENLAKEICCKVPMTKSYLAVRKSRWSDELYNGNQTLSLSYQREILTVACMITKWATNRRPSLLQQNPFESFKLPEVPEHLYDYWRLEEEDQFLNWLEGGGHYQIGTTRYHHKGREKSYITLQIRNSGELRDIVLFALRTGMRLGEIGALRNMDVDLTGGFIMVRGSFSRKEGRLKNTTKNKKARRIEINGDVRDILEKRKLTPKDEPIFNIHMNSIKFFSRTCRWAGVKEIHFHSLRHTCLTNLANGYGMDKPLPLPKVQQIAGHTDITTTMRYVHNDIINETASLQWSRTDRKAKNIADFKQKKGFISLTPTKEFDDLKP